MFYSANIPGRYVRAIRPERVLNKQPEFWTRDGRFCVDHPQGSAYAEVVSMKLDRKHGRTYRR